MSHPLWRIVDTLEFRSSGDSRDMTSPNYEPHHAKMVCLSCREQGLTIICYKCTLEFCTQCAPPLRMRDPKTRKHTKTVFICGGCRC